MILNDPLSLENLWDAILSCEVERIVKAFSQLNPDEQNGILKHLERMTTEKGWHGDQVTSAQAALKAIRQTPSED